MKKWFWLFLAFIALAVALTIVCDRVSRARGRRSLEQYKAELRAKGEKLTWAELGFPRPAETNENFEAFLSAAARLGGGNPSLVAGCARSYIAPGQARVAWATDALVLSNLGLKATNTLSWTELEAELNASADVLAEIRRAVETPPAFWMSDPTNTNARLVGNFIPRRNAAQWLTADCLAALHARQLDRARGDVHALIQSAQAYREDLTLVSQMIRVAIAGSALSATWEMLQTTGWTEPDLAAMQKDWEELDLARSIELGIIGERAYFGYHSTLLYAGMFNAVRSPPGVGQGAQPSPGGLLDRLILLPVWRATADADQLLYLRLTQTVLDAVRQSGNNQGYGLVRAALETVNAELGRENRGLGRYSHMLTLMLTPNHTRAIESAIRRETERRMTVAAIALKRYQFRQGRWPSSLPALVPEFLKTVPIDQMSGKPLVYRLNADGTFVLYSVGEDGKDDGGDPKPLTLTSPNLWNGRDAVWPTAVFSNAPPTAADSSPSQEHPTP